MELHEKLSNNETVKFGKVRLWAAIGFAMILTLAACGGGDEAEVSAIDEAGAEIASSDGVARADGDADTDESEQGGSTELDPELCSNLVDFDAALLIVPEGEDRSLGALDEVDAVIATLPDDVSVDVSTYFDVRRDSFILKPGSPEDLESGTRFMTLDTNAITSFLSTACPNGEIPDDGQLALGLFAIGVAQDLMEEENGGDSSATTEDQGTAVAVEPAVEPAVENSLALDPGTPLEMSYESVTFVIDDAVASNAEITGYVTDGLLDPGDANFVLIDIFAEAQTDDSNSFVPTDFRLIGPDGRSFAANNVYSTAGQDQGRLNVQPRSSVTTRMLFETDELLTSLDGFIFALERENHAPGQIDLTNPVPSEYPIVLESGATGTMISQSTQADCPDTWDTTVVDAEITLENDRFGPTRSTRNTRYVDISLDGLNATTPTDVFCEIATGQLFAVNVRLLVDGRPLPTFDTSASSSRIEYDTIGTLFLTYEIPADATELVLLGPEDEAVLATWDIEAPLVPGE